MRGLGHRQMTIQKMRMIKRRQHVMQKGGKRVPLSRRGPRK